MIVLLFSAIISFFLSYFSIPLIVIISNKKNLFDVPNPRKLNLVKVPTLGGIAIFLGATLGSVIFLHNQTVPSLKYFSAAIIIMFFTGLKDDIFTISPGKKLMAQFAAALLLVLPGNFRVVHTYGLFSVQLLNDWVNIPLSILAIIFLINAINLIDGIDGLAAGISLLIAILLGSWFYLSGHSDYGTWCMALSGSLLAFLRFNIWGGKNKIFMGDTGSLALGVALAAIVIRFNELNFASHNSFHFPQSPVVILALFIVPVTDTLWVTAIRIRQKRSPFSPDMNHFHHLLIKLGMKHIMASSILIAYTALFIALALILVNKHINITLNFVLLLFFSFLIIALVHGKSKQTRAQSVFDGQKTHSGAKNIKTAN